MSVLTRGLAMDIEQQGWRDVAITSLWPAVVRIHLLSETGLACEHVVFKADRIYRI